MTHGNKEESYVSIYHNPKLIGISEKISTISIYYVYDQYPRHTNLRHAKSLLISPVQYLDPTKDREELIVGWIDREKVSFWDTRSGIALKPGQYQLKLVDQERNQIGEISFQLDRPLRHDELRYPLLKSFDDAYEIAVFSSQKLKVIKDYDSVLKKSRLYQRYWQGELSKQTPGIEEQLLLSREYLENLSTQLMRMINTPHALSERLEVWNGFLKRLFWKK